jgi:predicted nucleic acid-binding protein
MILVDTTVWIDFFSGRHTKQVDRLVNIIEQKEELCLCGIILTEILQGVRNMREYKEVNTLFSSLFFLDMKQETFVLAAKIYSSLRLRGITIRKTLDCMIAAVAIEHQVPLLHHDRDFEPIEKYCGLKAVILGE